MSYAIPPSLKGLTTEEVKKSQQEYGFNQLKSEKKDSWGILLWEILKEPMLILLLVISVIYLLTANYNEALFMFAAIVLVSGISFYQDNHSRKALEELEKLNEPLSTVIRDGIAKEVPTHEIAVGDLCITSEGKIINADGVIVHSNDFSVNESALTGESFSVFKDKDSEDPHVYSGTTTVSGLAVFRVGQIGKNTRIGKIGSAVEEIAAQSSPLQQQISKFVKGMAVIGILIFLMVWGYSYLQTGNLLNSLLDGLTLAMSVLPEEIPVAFTTFMALGAWKLMKEGVIVKRSNLVETLGSTTVICTDKTGTITENSMQLKNLYDFTGNKCYDASEFKSPALRNLISAAMWSSEPVPFDPMEKTLHKIYEETQASDERRNFRMVHEYPLEGKPPMMTHIYEDEEGNRIIAAKGAPETIIAVSNLSDKEKITIRAEIKALAKQGLRLLGVAVSDFNGKDFPEKQQQLKFRFLGLTAFYDPPKKGIKETFDHIYQAGIKLKVITGDNAETTNAIATQAGIRNAEFSISGEELLPLTDAELQKAAEKNTVFSRMFPEAKLSVVNSLKKNEEIVAMLGDGVNDAPALKSAHIGVAMGNKGTEIAKAAADLVITNDDLDKLIVGIAAGRRIYANLKKAIQYIISIHIPIILTVSLPLFLGWLYPQIFTPVHVIFLELVMGPTCSIVYENEPMEKHAMHRPPRKITETFLSWRELSLSIVQGLAITAGVLFAYQFSASQGVSEEETRAMTFGTLVFANLLLSYANRSFVHSTFYTLRYKNPLLSGISILVLILIFVILYTEPVARFFKVVPLSAENLGVAALCAAVSVLWFDVYKIFVRKNFRKNQKKKSKI